MTPSFLRSTTAACVLVSGAVLMGCNNQKSPPQKPAAPKSVAAPDRAPETKPEAPAEQIADSKSSVEHVPAEAKSSAEPAPAEPKANPAPAARGLVVEGEHFTPRIVRDQQQGLIFSVFQAPEKWRDQSQVVWNYAYIANPVVRSGSVENPDNDEALYVFPSARYFWCTPNYGQSQPGQNSMGLIEAQRVPPLQALVYFIRQTRGGFPKLEFTGYKDLPDLPAALKVTPYPNMKMTGLAARVTYERNGHMVEEEFYCLPYSLDIPYDGPQGRSWQNNWGLDMLHSFRAPLGTLHKRRAIFTAMVKSERANPAWQQRQQAIVAYLNDQFNRQLQAGYDKIAAAGRLSRQVSANNDAMIASIDRQLGSSRTGVGGSGASQGRSGADNFDDYIRGVETVNDPYYGTSQHSANEKYHWTDGYGAYRNSNDPSYDPSRNENGNWQLMERVR